MQSSTENDAVLRVLRSYPVDGTYKFIWRQQPEYSGVTRDIIYGGELILAKQSGLSCYCCGITFEVFHFLLQELQESNRICMNLSIDAYHKLRKDWYCSTNEADMERGVQKALVSCGLGNIIDLKDVQMGDFIQYWRTNGSGHSVIFLEWLDDSKTGFRYWSSQNATNGIGVCEEHFEQGGGRIIRERTYIVRLKLENL
jgi:hypothetical protein